MNWDAELDAPEDEAVELPWEEPEEWGLALKEAERDAALWKALEEEGACTR